MHDLLIIGFRTVLLYVIIVIILRIMGKRELGELGVIDVVVFIVMAEVAAFALDDPNKKLIQSIVPMLILLAIQLLSSFMSLKSKKFRDLVDGDPTLIIKDGKILEKEMRKQRYNLDDLFQQLREQSIGSVHEVSIAYLEPSGSLSVFTKDDVHPILHSLRTDLFNIGILGCAEKRKNGFYKKSDCSESTMSVKFFTVRLKRVN